MAARTEELEAFYHSTRWVHTAKNYRRRMKYTCERCGSFANTVHHKTYLTSKNVADDDVALNPANLELLCRECHEKQHGRRKNEERRKVYFDYRGQPYILPQTGDIGDKRN